MAIDNFRNAAASYLKKNGDPRFARQSTETALEFAKQSQLAGDAVGARAGSIAARSNPLQYGSVASRQFADAFGADQQRALGAVNGALAQMPNAQRADAQQPLAATFASGRFDSLQPTADKLRQQALAPALAPPQSAAPNPYDVDNWAPPSMRGKQRRRGFA